MTLTERLDEIETNDGRLMSTANGRYLLDVARAAEKLADVVEEWSSWRQEDEALAEFRRAAEAAWPKEDRK